MKIICNKSNLVKGINTVLKAVPSKTTMSILECILVDCSNGIIKLTANDMELGIETIIEGDIITPGIVAIDAKLFYRIISNCSDDDVTIETNPNYQTTITCEKAIFNISSKPGDDFSKLPNIEKEEYITLSEFSLKEIIRQTIFSIADNDSNKLMTGELFEIKDNVLKVVSLDGHRISLRKIELSESYDDKKIVVPGKTLQEITKIISGEVSKEVKMYITENHILFEFENTVVVSRLIEGEYFNVNQMMSHDYNTKITVNKRGLLNCINRATLLIEEGDKKPIIINILDDTMELKIISQKGNWDEDMIITKEGKDLMIGFNPKFLIDALKVIDNDEITMYFMNAKAPCFIKNEEDTYTYLVLPVNFNVGV